MNKQSGFTLLELIIVVAIFTLIMGVTFSLLSSSRLSTSITEAQIQTQETARNAMTRLTQDLRRSSNVNSPLGVDVIDIGRGHRNLIFQVPVVDATGELALDDINQIQWGSKDKVDGSVTYELNTGQLTRIAQSQAGQVSTLIADGLSSIEYDVTNDSIAITIISEAAWSQNPLRTVTHQLTSTVNFRN